VIVSVRLALQKKIDWLSDEHSDGIGIVLDLPICRRDGHDDTGRGQLRCDTIAEETHRTSPKNVVRRSEAFGGSLMAFDTQSTSNFQNH
jgi:hypothetical protein